MKFVVWKNNLGAKFCKKVWTVLKKRHEYKFSIKNNPKKLFNFGGFDRKKKEIKSSGKQFFRRLLTDIFLFWRENTKKKFFF